jgi:hypothetical protein
MNKIIIQKTTHYSCFDIFEKKKQEFGEKNLFLQLWASVVLFVRIYAFSHSFCKLISGNYSIIA